MGEIRTHHHWAESLPTSKEGNEKELKHVKEFLRTCDYHNWAFIKYIKRPNMNSSTTDKEENNKPSNIVIPYVAGISETLRKISNQQFKPTFLSIQNVGFCCLQLEGR